MAHFATIDNTTNNVIRVEVINNAVITDSDGKEQEQLGIDFLEQIHGGGGVTYKQTSYNNNIRKNFVCHRNSFWRSSFFQPVISICYFSNFFIFIN